jgi:type I restriction enzyme R subunit
MQSLNFETLRTRYPQLADLGGFAEQYLYSDPEGAATKLRKFGEALTAAIFAHYKLPRPSYTQYDLLRTSTFKSIVPEEIRRKFDSVRITGNDGTHPEGLVTEDDALARLKDAHDLGKIRLAAPNSPSSYGSANGVDRSFWVTSPCCVLLGPAG